MKTLMKLALFPGGYIVAILLGGYVIYNKMKGGADRDILSVTGKLASLIIHFSIISWMGIVGLAYSFDLLGFLLALWNALELLWIDFRELTSILWTFIMFKLIEWVWKLLFK